MLRREWVNGWLTAPCIENVRRAQPLPFRALMGAEQRLQGYTAAHEKARARRAELKGNASGRSSLTAPRSRLIVVAMRHPQGKCAHSESNWFQYGMKRGSFPWAGGRD